MNSIHRGRGRGAIPACLAAGLGGGWYPSMPCRFPGPHPRGKFRGIWPGGGSPGPHPRGNLRGIWSMPTPKGELEGDLAGRVLAPGGCLPRGGGDSNPWLLLLRAVRILLECILIWNVFKYAETNNTHNLQWHKKHFFQRLYLEASWHLSENCNRTSKKTRSLSNRRLPIDVLAT